MLMPIEVAPSSLQSYVGIPPFDNERYYKAMPPGVVLGLAWTKMGGALLYVEVVNSGGRSDFVIRARATPFCPSPVHSDHRPTAP